MSPSQEVESDPECENKDSTTKNEGGDVTQELPAVSKKWDISKFSAMKKRILFVTMCSFHFFSFVFSQLPYSYLASYNTDRDISTYWTGLILGASSVGHAVCCVFIASIIVNRFSTRMLVSVCMIGQGCSVFLFAALDAVEDVTAYKILGLFSRYLVGTFSGVLNVTAFAAYLSLIHI